MPNAMEGLLIATGFTGGLTIVWMARMIWTRLFPRGTITVHFGEQGGIAPLLAAITTARRDILVVAQTFSSRALAQSLVEARLRGLSVEILLDTSNEHDPTSELPFLRENGMTPICKTVDELVVLVDTGTVMTGTFRLVPDDQPGRGSLLIVKGHADLANSYREQFQPGKPDKEMVILPTPVVDEQAGAIPIKADVLTEVARDLTRPVEASEPVVTPAAAQLFARLRKELSESGASPPEDKKKTG